MRHDALIDKKEFEQLHADMLSTYWSDPGQRLAIGRSLQKLIFRSDPEQKIIEEYTRVHTLGGFAAQQSVASGQAAYGRPFRHTILALGVVDRPL